MNSILVLINLDNKNTYEFEKKNLTNLSNYLQKIIIINVGKILGNNKLNINHNFNEKFEVLNPENYNELYKLLKFYNIPILYCLSLDLQFFKINFFLAKLKNKKFVISNLGYQPQNFNYVNQTFINNFIFFFKFRINYYLKRLLLLFGIFPKIDYFFESSQYIIDNINQGLSKKLDALNFGVNFSYYKNVIKINSRVWDNHFYKKFEQTEEYIVFIDGMIFDHPDRIMREGPVNLKNRNNYYQQINKLLIHLSEKYKKEVIICLHPKNNLSENNKDFKKFKCIKFQTDKYINRSYIVLFHEGSSIIEAVLLKKKIINIDGKSLGPYINNRAKLYRDLLNLKKVDLDNYLIDIENIKDKDFNNLSNFEEYIKKNIVFDKGVSGAYQIINHLKNKDI